MPENKKTFTLKRAVSEGERRATPAAASGRKALIPPEKRHGPVLAVAAAPRRKGPGKGVIWGVFAGVLVVAAGVGLYLYLQEKSYAARREALALRAAQTATSGTYARIHPFVTRVAAMLTQAEESVRVAEEAVQFVTGKPLAEQSSSAASSAAVRRPAATAPPPSTAPAPAVRPTVAARDDGVFAPENVGDRDKPEGIESIAALERRRRPPAPAAVQTNTPAAGAATNAAASSAAPPPAPAPVPVAAAPVARGGPEIVRLAGEICAQRDRMREQQSAINTSAAEAEEVGKAAMRARTSAEAAQASAKVGSIVVGIENAAGLVAASLDQIRQADTRVAALRDQEVQSRKARAEETQRQQAAAELAALIEKEKQRATDMHAKCRNLVVSYGFTAAKAELEAALLVAKTPEGKAALQGVIDRYRRLEAMLEGLIKNLNQKPYRWAWGGGAKAKDVDSANAEGVVVAGKQIPWVKVPLPQFIKLVDHYQSSQDEKTRARSEMAVALALLCDEAGLKIEATDYVRRARELGEHVAGELSALMPGY
jgi:hypothetical protein